MNHDNRFHVIKDPVHGTMQFSAAENDWIKPFIDSPPFQRLRHVKQLGLGDFIFPGAVHTRFNHSLGCCYTASQIAKKIGLAEEERQLVMTACLLHDIGHGPFSHAFEDVFHQKMIRHEAWTPFFLRYYGTKEFFDAYNRNNPRHHLTVDKFSIIENMIMHNAVNKKVLADIVSSQLDADRLDYLLRDSHFCGVTYGEFDFRWMLNCMAIVNSPTGERLGLTHKGIGVVEHYLMARRLMTRNIYHHPKKLAIEFFLIKLLAQLAENLETYPPFERIKKTRLGRFLVKVNSFNKKVRSHRDPEKIKQQFLESHFADYKELCDYDVFVIIRLLASLEDNHAATLLAKRIHYRQMPLIIHLDSKLTKAKEQIKEFNYPDWQLAIIETPHQAYKASEDPILIQNELGVVKPLNEISFMIQAISDQKEQTAFLCVDHSIAEETKVKKWIHSLQA